MQARLEARSNRPRRRWCLHLHLHLELEVELGVRGARLRAVLWVEVVVQMGRMSRWVVREWACGLGSLIWGGLG